MNLNQFLDTSYTAYHTTENVRQILLKNGYTELSLGKKWNIRENGRYFVTRNGSSIIAFAVGKNKVFNICQSHTDSPSFKVKGNGVMVSEGIKRINTEKYGGGLLYTYFDRPLKIAGRVLAETENGVEQKLVVSDFNVVIPSLAIHHNPTANDGVAINAQVDTLPLLGQSAENVYSQLGVKNVLDADLYVVPATQAFLAGASNEFLCSARLDNLTSVYSSVTALVNSKPQDIAVVACLDNEEVGSSTRQGHPNFVKQTLKTLAAALNMDSVELRFAYENGMSLSVDNGHAVHPAHPEKSDPQVKVKLNGGIVIKHHPNYATDGLASAILKKICKQADVPVQDYYNNSSVRCGSTLGLVTAMSLGIKTCDIGIGQLAMHSACETCGVNDITLMEKCLTAFLSVKLTDNGKNVEIE